MLRSWRLISGACARLRIGRAGGQVPAHREAEFVALRLARVLQFVGKGAHQRDSATAGEGVVEAEVGVLLNMRGMLKAGPLDDGRAPSEMVERLNAWLTNPPPMTWAARLKRLVFG